jgi:hypothetical protein
MNAQVLYRRKYVLPPPANRIFISLVITTSPHLKKLRVLSFKSCKIDPAGTFSGRDRLEIGGAHSPRRQTASRICYLTRKLTHSVFLVRHAFTGQNCHWKVSSARHVISYYYFIIVLRIVNFGNDWDPYTHTHNTHEMSAFTTVIMSANSKECIIRLDNPWH